MLNKKIGTYILLFFAFGFAAFLRLYNLSDFPVGFHIDEASLGYNGYSLLLTGKDENNNILPLYIDMFGDNRPSGYHYLTILPVKIFGLNEFSTRLPAAIFGSLSVLVIFFLTYTLFRSRLIAFMASLFMAIAPWHIVLSRASGEAIVALFFIMTGASFIIRSLINHSKSNLIFGTFSLSISYFFYHTPRVFVPLLFTGLLIFLYPKLRKIENKSYIATLVSSLMFTGVIAILLVFFVSGGTGRFAQVNIFSFPETKLIMNEQIQEDGMEKRSVLETRIFHNKIINYSLTFTSNYLAYFNGDFLFMKGGLPIWYVVPNVGLIYLIYIPFIIFGLIMLSTHKERFYKIPLIWILIAPITAAITVDDIPNINRVIVLFPMLEILAAYGVYACIKRYQSKWRPVFIFLVFTIVIFNFSYFIHQYFVHAHRHRTWYRNNGFKEMILTLKSEYNNYDKILITKASGGIYPLILFYMQYDPVFYQKEGSPKGPDYKGFGKFVFVPQACPTRDKDEKFPKNQKVLYVNKGDCPDTRFVLFKDILKEDGTRAFRLQL